MKEVLSGHVTRVGRSDSEFESCDYEPVAIVTYDADIVHFQEPTVLLPSHRNKNIKMRKTKVFSVFHC